MMFCDMVGVCGGCSVSDDYVEELTQKQNKILSLFQLDPFMLEVFSSPVLGYRSRCSFRVYRENNKVFLAMSLFGRKKYIKISKCPILLPCIQNALDSILKYINQDQILEHKLYAIEAMASISGEVMLTLIYHKHLDSSWYGNALELSKKMHIHIIGRSRKQKIILTQDFLIDALNILGKRYVYIRQEGRFCQPNVYINSKMIEFVKMNIQSHKRVDLIEMYCGDGNFSIPLADMFEKIFATEIVKSCIETFKKNTIYNCIYNITNIRLSGEETVSAFRFEREFFRLKGIDLKSFCFSHILIDPPRSGIRDKQKLAFIAEFSYIIYISCNPLALQQDIEFLKKSHIIEKFAFFNQFPHTKHIECVVILRMKNL